MEIYTLTLSFPNEENEEPWSRTIEVKEDFTLQKLHKYVQKIIDFDDDHLYEFDFGDCWLFQIKKSRKKKTVEKQKKYPVLIESKGSNPEQYPDYEE